MIEGQRLTVVMPAFNAQETLERSVAELPHDIVDDVILTDDASTDATVAEARRLGLRVLEHSENLGYGANQKTCYQEALATGADIIIMLHPDYQYSPRLVRALASMVASGHYDLALGSRILGGNARDSGMPTYKYVSNRALTFVQNAVCRAKLSEYHTGFRAFSRILLETIPFPHNSDDFVFDNQVITQALHFGFRVGEITCPARYFKEASSIGLGRSIVYGSGVLRTLASFRLHRLGLKSALFESDAGFRRPGRTQDGARDRGPRANGAARADCQREED